MTVVLAGFWIFVISIFVLELAFYALNSIRYPNRTKVRKRLEMLSEEDFSRSPSTILRKSVLSDISFLDRILFHIPGVQSLGRLIRQASSSYSAGFYILFSLFMGLTSIIIGWVFLKNIVISLPLACLLGCSPIYLLHLKKKKRVKKFQRQLPEALELIARALKAGHAFTSGLKLAAEEFTEPLGSEFEETLDEINFGVSVADALKNLSNRVDCPELKFFVVAVILQRETGGNLADIIESLAQLIRERFKFEGRVRVLSSEGRLSAVILVVLPFVIAVLLRFLNPDYMDTLFSEPAGRLAVGIAFITMTVGIIFIKKMVKINV